MGTPGLDEFLRSHRRRLEALFKSSGAARWGVALEEFSSAVWDGVRRAAVGGAGVLPTHLDSIQVRDLALALGCARGNEDAWNTFCSQFRSTLYEGAYALMREDSRGRELADSLLAELFGVESSAAARRSLFTYFHGRSTLKTWLRAVLHQKFVNQYRRESRLEALPENYAETAQARGATSVEDERRYDACLGEAVEQALANLPPREKLLLAYYYAQGMTLQQIGRVTGEHQATISRHLEALRKRLRKRIEGHLRDVQKLSAFEVERCLDFASRGVGVELDKVLKPE